MAEGLSDFNANKASNIAVKNVFTDIPLSFKAHPIKKDILPISDLDAVKQSIKNIVLTNQGERPFQMGIGGDVTRYLFEPVNALTAFTLKEEITRTIEENESRVSDLSVEVAADIDRNKFEVTVSFRAIFSDTREEINFALERLR